MGGLSQAVDPVARTTCDWVLTVLFVWLLSRCVFSLDRMELHYIGSEYAKTIVVLRRDVAKQPAALS